MRRIGSKSPFDPAARVGGDASSFMEKLHGAHAEAHLDRAEARQLLTQIPYGHRELGSNGV